MLVPTALRNVLARENSQMFSLKEVRAVTLRNDPDKQSLEVGRFREPLGVGCVWKGVEI
jgi:hypothetical protein